MPKNVWKPTESEFDEMGFVQNPTYARKRYVLGTHYDWIRCDIVYSQEGEDPLYYWEIFVETNRSGFVPLYPESRQDVETLIRLMTP